VKTVLLENRLRNVSQSVERLTREVASLGRQTSPSRPAGV
jgi:hypothetical protein